MKKLVVLILLLTSVAPANAAPKYIFPVPDCEVTYTRAHHDYPASDIFAKTSCKFVSPVNGVIDEVNRVDNWSGKTNLGVDRGGLYVSVIGEDGVRYYGSHLRSVVTSIQPGVTVKAGQILGRIGATGSARGYQTPSTFWNLLANSNRYPTKYLVGASRNRFTMETFK